MNDTIGMWESTCTEVSSVEWSQQSGFLAGLLAGTGLYVVLPEVVACCTDAVIISGRRATYHCLAVTCQFAAACLPACFACLLGSVGLYSPPRAIPAPRFVSLKFYIRTIHTFFAVVSIILSGAVQY